MFQDFNNFRFKRNMLQDLNNFRTKRMLEPILTPQMQNNFDLAELESELDNFLTDYSKKTDSHLGSWIRNI